MNELGSIHFDGFYRKLVANQDIHQGETIVVLPLDSQDYPDQYSIEASPGIHINCEQSIAGAINHSCNPNAAVRHFRIIAWKCIKENEEITIDYRKTEYKMAVPFECQCGFCESGTVIKGME